MTVGWALRQSGSRAVVVEVVERRRDQVALDVQVQVDRFRAHVAVDVDEADLAAWGAALRAVHASLQGEAVLDEHPLRLALRGDGRGRVTLDGELDSSRGWGDDAVATLRFRFEALDQTHLLSVAAAVEEALALPVEPDDDEGTPTTSTLERPPRT